MLRYFLPALIAIPFVLAYGIAQGYLADRWGLSQELDQAAERLAQLPTTIGDWDGADQEIGERQVAQAELRGHIKRQYTNRKTGEAVTVLLVCGKPGPIAVHSPEVCFGGAGYRPAASPAKQSIEGVPSEFWTARFDKSGAINDPIDLWWGWNASGVWEAVENPRFHFGRQRALFKLYVIRSATNSGEAAEVDPITDFLRVFLPEANSCLFPPS